MIKLMINNLINFVQNSPNENIRARDKGDTESSTT